MQCGECVCSKVIMSAAPAVLNSVLIVADKYPAAHLQYTLFRN